MKKPFPGGCSFNFIFRNKNQFSSVNIDFVVFLLWIKNKEIEEKRKL